MKNLGGITTTFTNGIVKKAEQGGDWGGKLGAGVPDGPPESPGEIQGHDTVSIDGANQGGLSHLPTINGRKPTL